MAPALLEAVTPATRSLKASPVNAPSWTDVGLPDAPSLQARMYREPVKPFSIVDAPSAWYVKDFRDSSDYTYTLSEEDISELDAAVKTAMKSGADIKTVTRAQFSLPNLGPKFEALRDEVVFGRGFVLIRGVPVQRYSRQESVVAYWGMGLYWGKAVSQNKKGHLVGHIKDIGHDPNLPTTRLYATHEAQPYHNDSADLVSLLCLQNAKEGGLSSWSSSITVHNEIVKQRPDLARVLAGPWFMDRKGEVPAGKKPYFMIPVFNYHDGFLSINYSDNYYRLSQRHEEVPRLTEAHYEAMELFTRLASSDELRMDYLLEEGDIQLLNNHHCLHMRTAFIDWPEFDRRRHLLRLWLSPPAERELPLEFLEIYGGRIVVGDRAGIWLEGVDTNVPLEAE